MKNQILAISSALALCFSTVAFAHVDVIMTNNSGTYASTAADRSAKAQATAPTNDEKAKKLLDEVSAKVRSYKTVSIDFKYALDNKSEDIHQSTRGSVHLMGEKYSLDLMGISMLYDGKQLYQISTEDEEINISTPTGDDEMEISPSSMLSFYENGYTYEWDIEQNVRGRKIQYIRLKPMDSNSENKSILLGIDVQTKHIYNMIQTQKNGTKITITVNSMKPNMPMPASTFKFDESKYDGFYINRLD